MSACAFLGNEVESRTVHQGKGSQTTLNYVF